MELPLNLDPAVIHRLNPLGLRFQNQRTFQLLSLNTTMNHHLREVRHSYSGVMQVGGIARFTSAAAIGDINDVLCDQLCAADRTFSKTVSRSILEYYVSQIYYMRIAQIQLQNGAANLETRNMTEQGSNCKWVIPRIFAEYLKRIGNFRDSTGMVSEYVEVLQPDDTVFNGYVVSLVK